ncbi:MAG: patatin-like phospholipase family protein [Candidatus Thorarchaeota archaeon]
MKKLGFAGSGGGAKGAWGAGVSHFLVHDLGREYKALSGTSTGALLMNLVATGQTEKLKEAYTNVNNDDIYKTAPYRIKRTKHGIFKTKMNYFKIGWNIFFKKQKTFGDSSKLREVLIPQFFTKDDYLNLKEFNVELISCVTNLTKGLTEYKSSFEEEYEDFLDWIFASTCAAPFMSLVEKDGCEYADGGYIEHIPIQVLIDKGCTEIDVIEHAAPEIEIEKIRNPLHLVSRLMDITMWENAKNDLVVAGLKAADEDVILNFYQPNRKLTNNSLVFDQQTMESWWEEGYNSAKQQHCKKYIISKGKKAKLISNNSTL